MRYFNVGAPEIQPNGPSALAVAPDGSFYIADLVAGRVLHLDPGGKPLPFIDLSRDAVGITDIGVTPSGRLRVLDSAAIIPRLFDLSAQGELKNIYDLPPGLRLEDGLTGITLGEDGETLIELEGGARWVQFLDARGRYNRRSLQGYPFRGLLFRAAGKSFWAGEIKIDLPFTEGGSLRLLGVYPDGSFFLVQDDLVSANPITVVETVHYFRPDGQQAGAARIPLDEQFIYTPNPLALSPQGQVYFLLTRPQQVDIVRLKFYRQLQP